MSLSQTMYFFDINYGEYASATGTNLVSGTQIYAYDNRSDTGLVNYNSTTGDFIYDFGTGVSFDIDYILLCNHNLKDFNLAVALTSTGALTTLTTYSNQTTTTHAYYIGSLTTVYDVKLTFTDTQDSAVGYFGEFIITKKKFQLTYNPNIYVPKITPSLVGNKLWDGKNVFAKKAAGVFEADIGWDNLIGDANTITNTDLQNVTELIRNNTSFIFWPNANNDFVNMYTWRKQDIYKCKIVDAAKYEFISPAVTYIIKGIGYKIREIR